MAQKYDLYDTKISSVGSNLNKLVSP